MQKNSLILVALLALCAIAPGVFWKFSSQKKSVPLSTDDLSRSRLPKGQKPPTAVPPKESIAQPTSKSRKELSYVVKIKDNQVEFKLTNKGSGAHIFYGGSLSLRGFYGVPAHANVQVLKEDGSIFSRWHSRMQTDSWSPLLFSSDTISLPVESQSIDPGETHSLIVPIENFFYRSDFDLKARHHKIRVVSYLYLDAYLRHSIESKSELVELKL